MNTNNTGNRVSGEPRMGMVSDEVDERIYDKDLAHAWALKKMGYDADLKEISRIQQSGMLGRESVRRAGDLMKSIQRDAADAEVAMYKRDREILEFKEATAEAQSNGLKEAREFIPELPLDAGDRTPDKAEQDRARQEFSQLIEDTMDEHRDSVQSMGAALLTSGFPIAHPRGWIEGGSDGSIVSHNLHLISREREGGSFLLVSIDQPTKEWYSGNPDEGTSINVTVLKPNSSEEHAAVYSDALEYTDLETSGATADSLGGQITHVTGDFYMGMSPGGVSIDGGPTEVPLDPEWVEAIAAVIRDGKPIEGALQGIDMSGIHSQLNIDGKVPGNGFRISDANNPPIEGGIEGFYSSYDEDSLLKPRVRNLASPKQAS